MFKPGVVSKSTGGGGGGDVTPNPTPNWANIAFDENTGLYTAAVQQVQGISTSITLELSISNAANIIIYYRVDGSAPSWTNGGTEWNGDPTGWTQVASFPVTFSVSNNQYVSFGCEPSGINVLKTLTVKNNSDGAVTLDTFTATITFVE
jgi:hypothetical protein